MLAFVVELTATVVMVNVALDAPDATVTLAGTVALEELELNFTLRPPGPAGPLSVTVPVDGLPPATEVGDTERPVSAAGVIVSVAFFEALLRVAVIVAEV